MGCCMCKEQTMSDDTFKLYQYILESTPYYLFDILEKCPQQYYRILCKAVECNYDLRPYLNDTTYYNTWYSNHMFCLTYCVGDLKFIPEKDSNFYGKNTSIDQNLGIKILDKLIELDTNMYSTNYYGSTIIDSIHKSGLTKRTNNDKFIKKLCNYYHNSNYSYESNTDYQQLHNDECSKV